MTIEEKFDARQLRDVLSTFVTGVTVVTTTDSEGIPHGLTANSFSSVSLDPPLVLWSQSLTSPSYRVFRDAERFCISILADDQVDVSNIFARPNKNKFENIPIRMGYGNIPLIEGCAATLECSLVASYPGGDHAVFIGRVDRIEKYSKRPLAFGLGKYLVPQRHESIAPPSSAVAASIAELQAVRMATQEAVSLREQLDETIGVGVWGNKGPTIVRWEESSYRVSDNLRTGLVLPVLKSSTGILFAAHLPEEAVAQVLECEFAAEQISSAAASAALKEMSRTLSQVRDAGAVTLAGSDAFISLYGARINAISTPVFNRHGTMVIALTAIGGADKLDINESGKIIPALRQAAQSLSSKLGYMK